jgi:hypothetical protein
MSKYGGSIVGKSAIWNVTTGYHSSYYGGPLIAGVPDRMDVEGDAPTTAEASAAAGKKKNTSFDGGYGDDD